MTTSAPPWRNTPERLADGFAERRWSDSSKDTLSAANSWRPLQLFNLYRLLLGLGLCSLLLLNDRHDVFAKIEPAPFTLIAIGYLLSSLGFLITIYQRWPNYGKQVNIQVITDILAISLLAQFGGGFGNDIGVLLAVSVAGGSVLSAGRTALFFAALASVAVLLETTYNQQLPAGSSSDYTHAGVLGITFFATALLASTLGQRIRASEHLAAQRGSDLLTMEQLTRYIVQRMQTGVMVLDNENRLRLANHSTRTLLGLADEETDDNILRLHPQLGEQLQRWQEDNHYETSAIVTNQGANEILPRFARLGRAGETAGTLIFLEDTSALSVQAQQLKLASLGRLTASIAHEIRNPLGAISHAGQLLAESAVLHKGDQRLTEIINQQSKRLNTIVDNVMQLSQRKAPNTEEIELDAWLKKLAAEFCASYRLDPQQLSIVNEAGPNHIRFDPSHLHQIVWNLGVNALLHSHIARDQVRILLRPAHIGGQPHLPCLDIIDNGPGISADVAEKIFEPFFTTNNNGTGLGLYIARELCANNQARLNYIHQANGGACFRISFSDARRRQQAA